MIARSASVEHPGSNAPPRSSSADITVGIPYHAKADPAHLREAIESILAQTLRPDCIHLIQDGPVPAKLSAVVALYEGRPDVRCLALSRNQGLPTALNLSILAASTRYYARMDADDIAHPERLERQVGFLDEHPDIAILGTGAIEFEVRIDEPGAFVKLLPATQREIARLFHFRDPFVHPSVVFRRDVFATIGVYNPEFLTDQDTELWARALTRGVGLANLQEPLLYFRVGTMITKRSEFGAIRRQFRSRYRYNTASFPLNVLKLGSLLFRFLPGRVRAFCYRRLR